MDTQLILLLGLAAVIVGLTLVVVLCCCCVRRSRKRRERKQQRLERDALNAQTLAAREKASGGLKQLEAHDPKYLGVSLSEIPFIDDSKCSSRTDLHSWNSHQQLTTK